MVNLLLQCIKMNGFTYILEWDNYKYSFNRFTARESVLQICFIKIHNSINL